MNDLNASPQNVPWTMPQKTSEVYYTGKFVPPPPPNIKVTIGEDAMTYFQYHCHKPPNRFQRWLTNKLLGIKVELI